MTEAPIDPGPESRPVLQFRKGMGKRVKSGHPWAFSNEIEITPEAKALPPGGLVTLADAGGAPMGVATFNPHSLIGARIMARNPRRRVDTAMIAERLGQALALRAALFDQPHYRLVHSEADGLPGLVIDRYGDTLAVQANTAGMDILTPLVLDALESLLSPTTIVLRNDASVREMEGLDRVVLLAKGAADGPVPVLEGGLTFLADPAGGQKTGWFFDQRPNRAFAARLAKDRTVLDAYTHSGGFGLTCGAAGARAVTLLDRSADSLALAESAARTNGLADRVSTLKGDAFAEMERLGEAGARFGLVISDPPAFAKVKKDVGSALKGYRKMARLSARLVEPGGFLVVASCSHHITPEAFAEEIRKGLGQAGRTGRILHSGGAGPDHPVLPVLPESAYLKCLALALD